MRMSSYKKGKRKWIMVDIQGFNYHVCMTAYVFVTNKSSSSLNYFDNDASNFNIWSFWQKFCPITGI